MVVRFLVRVQVYGSYFVFGYFSKSYAFLVHSTIVE